MSHGTQTSLIDKGPLLTSVLVRNLPTGANSVSVTGLNLQLPNSAVWIKFDESGVGAPNNFWLTGGVPGPGYSHPGLTYTVKDYYGRAKTTIFSSRFLTLSFPTHNGLFSQTSP